MCVCRYSLLGIRNENSQRRSVCFRNCFVEHVRMWIENVSSPTIVIPIKGMYGHKRLENFLKYFPE